MTTSLLCGVESWSPVLLSVEIWLGKSWVGKPTTIKYCERTTSFSGAELLVGRTYKYHFFVSRLQIWLIGTDP
jgi:hypothetical protein